ncbi:MAG TPA: hypothetical protein PK989_13265, partial [Anaerolineales bacterium]|nr:hypothetical protein [Anaerolineales bacterium]
MITTTVSATTNLVLVPQLGEGEVDVGSMRSGSYISEVGWIDILFDSIKDAGFYNKIKIPRELLLAGCLSSTNSP